MNSIQYLDRRRSPYAHIFPCFADSFDVYWRAGMSVALPFVLVAVALVALATAALARAMCCRGPAAENRQLIDEDSGSDSLVPAVSIPAPASGGDWKKQPPMQQATGTQEAEQTKAKSGNAAFEDDTVAPAATGSAPLQSLADPSIAPKSIVPHVPVSSQRSHSRDSLQAGPSQTQSPLQSSVPSGLAHVQLQVRSGRGLAAAPRCLAPQHACSLAARCAVVLVYCFWLAALQASWDVLDVYSLPIFGRTLLRADMRRGTDDTLYPLAHMAAWAAAGVYGAVIPLGVAFFLYGHRYNVRNMLFRSRFGFLFLGYVMPPHVGYRRAPDMLAVAGQCCWGFDLNRVVWMWQAVDLSKLALLACAVGLPASPELQGQAVLAILLCFLCLHLAVQPLQRALTNNMESMLQLSLVAAQGASLALIEQQRLSATAVALLRAAIAAAQAISTISIAVLLLYSSSGRLRGLCSKLSCRKPGDEMLSASDSSEQESGSSLHSVSLLGPGRYGARSLGAEQHAAPSLVASMRRAAAGDQRAGRKARMWQERRRDPHANSAREKYYATTASISSHVQAGAASAGGKGFNRRRDPFWYKRFLEQDAIAQRLRKDAASVLREYTAQQRQGAVGFKVLTRREKIRLLKVQLFGPPQAQLAGHRAPPVGKDDELPVASTSRPAEGLPVASSRQQPAHELDAGREEASLLQQLKNTLQPSHEQACQQGADGAVESDSLADEALLELLGLDEDDTSAGTTGAARSLGRHGRRTTHTRQQREERVVTMSSDS